MVRGVLLATVFMLALSGCGKDRVKKETVWGTYQEPVAAKKLPADSGVNELSLLWADDIGSSDQLGYNMLRPFFAGDSLFAANRQGRVLRKDAVSGETIWSAELEAELFSGVGVGEGLVVVTHNNGDVSALDAWSGDLAWTVSLKRQFSAIPVVGNSRVVVRTADGLIIGLRADNGEQVWQVNKETPGLTMHGDSQPAITGDALIVGLSSGKLIANNILSGRDYWEAEIGFVRGKNELERLNDSDTNPIIDGRRVYVAAYQGSVMAMTLENAEILWQQDISTRLPMAFSGDTLVVTGELGDVYALTTVDGGIVWHQDIFRGHGVTYPVIVGNRAIIGDANGNIHTLDLSTGALVQSRKTVSGAVTGLIASDGRIGVLSGAGQLRALSL